jgi:hypothetical protein
MIDFFHRDGRKFPSGRKYFFIGMEKNFRREEKIFSSGCQETIIGMTKNDHRDDEKRSPG